MTKKPVNLDNLTLSEIQEKGLQDLLIKSKGVKRGPGRPRLSLDKRSQFSLTYWFNLLMKEYTKLRPIQRTRIALDCWKTLINKANNLPADPEESRLNAAETLAALKGIEERTIPPISSGETNGIDGKATGEKTIEREKVPC